MPGSNRVARGIGQTPRWQGLTVRRRVLVWLTALAVTPAGFGQSPALPGVPLGSPAGATAVASTPLAMAPASAPGNPRIIVPSQETLPASAQLPQGSSPMPTPMPTPGAESQPMVPGGFGGILSDARFSPAPPTLGATPVTTPATREKINKLVQKLLDPESTLDLVTGQTRVLVLKDAPFRVQAGDDQVLGLTLVNPKEILLQGKTVGATVLNLWFNNPDDATQPITLSYLVRVYPDPEAKARMEAAYKQLQDEINAYFKDTSIQLKLIGDKVVVSGRVKDYIQGQQVLQMVRAGMPGQQGRGSAGGGSRGQAGGTAATVPLAVPGITVDPESGQLQPPNLSNFQSIGGPNVINLLEVAGEQQVLLRCVVAEVNRAAARSIGLNFSVRNNSGITVFSNNTGPIIPFNRAAGLGGFGGGFGFFSGGAIANLSAIFDSGKIPFAINALRTMQYAKSLAEPTLVTMNGQTANFLAGGQFPVPVVTGFTFSGLQGVQFIPYGVQLSFTPFITDRDRIRLVLNINVSARDIGIGANIGGANVAGLNTRSVFNTVELRSNETLAVAGLIETNSEADSTRIPFLGTLPVVGPLTGLTRTNVGEKELVIFVTPELTRPLDPEQVIKLPGHEILDPNDLEFYILGRIEGHCKDYRSPIRTDCDRIRQYQQLESAHMAGPTGYTTPAP